MGKDREIVRWFYRKIWNHDTATTEDIEKMWKIISERTIKLKSHDEDFLLLKLSDEMGLEVMPTIENGEAKLTYRLIRFGESGYDF
jgi:hypothetical protein